MENIVETGIRPNRSQELIQLQEPEIYDSSLQLSNEITQPNRQSMVGRDRMYINERSVSNEDISLLGVTQYLREQGNRNTLLSRPLNMVPPKLNIKS